MMALVFYVCLALGLSRLAAPLLVALWSVLLVTLVACLPVGAWLGFELGAYVLGLVSISLLAYWLCGSISWKSRHWSDYVGILIFLVAYSLCYCLCMQWPDFFPMGERLRDYSLIWAVVENPLHPQEPWFSGYQLFYYVGWYRFGHLLHHVLGLPVWEVYHTLVATPLALLVALAWMLGYRLLGSNVWLASVCALIVGFGSNIRGVLFFLQREQANWWDPSRVIKGAINEYPAWSFILGDAHPHYLNLPFVPLTLLVGLSLWSSASVRMRFYGLAVTAGLSFLWLQNANPWELPMLGGGYLVMGALGFANWYSSNTSAERRSNLQDLWVQIRPNLQVLAVLVVGIWCATMLVMFREEVRAGSVPIDLVRRPVERTYVDEAFMHWGFVLALAGLCLPLRLQLLSERVLAYGFFLGALLYEEIFGYLLFLLFIQALCCWRSFVRSRTYYELVAESCGFVGLGLLLLVELVFLNDAYGGENERMNTIFKVFTFAWLPLHLWVMYVLSDALQGPLAWLRRVPLVARGLVAVATVVFFCGCFVWMATADGIRKSPYADRWDAEGLRRVDQTFPGALQAIRRLRAEAADAVVLEAQAGAYSWCAHVATLAEKQSYLGWANHAGLLTQDYSEVSRREQLTKKIYESNSCADIKALMQSEGISHVVVGPLEHQHYQIDSSNFQCLQGIVNAGKYQIFRSL